MTSPPPKLTSPANTSDTEAKWQVFEIKDGIKIEFRYIECIKTNYGPDRENIILKFTNTTNEKKRVSWSLEAFREKICTTCDKDGEYDFELELKPNSSLEGNCSQNVDPRLKIFSKFLSPQFQNSKDNLTNFTLAQLTVVCIECDR